MPLALFFGMIRLEQVRSEMIVRFERVDRRFAQHEQRLARIDQRTTELSDRIEAVLAALQEAQERSPAGTTPSTEGTAAAAGTTAPPPANTPV
jgi:hypothetical protein